MVVGNQINDSNSLYEVRKYHLYQLKFVKTFQSFFLTILIKVFGIQIMSFLHSTSIHIFFYVDKFEANTHEYMTLL